MVAKYPENINIKGKRLTLLAIYGNRDKAIKAKTIWRKYNWKLLTLRGDPTNNTYAVYGFLEGGKKAVLAYMATVGLSARLTRALKKKKEVGGKGQ